jgi:murein DD-endopeptidase MepM/ murein hydrolase activator NlpD
VLISLTVPAYAAPLDTVLPVLSQWENAQKRPVPVPASKPVRNEPAAPAASTTAKVLGVLTHAPAKPEHVLVLKKPTPPHHPEDDVLAGVLPVLQEWEAQEEQAASAQKAAALPPTPVTKAQEREAEKTANVLPSPKPFLPTGEVKPQTIAVTEPTPVLRPSAQADTTQEEGVSDEVAAMLPAYIPIPIQRDQYNESSAPLEAPAANTPVPVMRLSSGQAHSAIAQSAVEQSIVKRDASRYGFIWPVNGLVVSRFGPKKGGLRNDGINIGVPEGTSVYATQEGEVVYAGNELKGYGNLVIMKHPEGYLSAYAHLKDITVTKGEAIPQGGRVGYVGKTGNVLEPQLHFGLRKGKIPVDPVEYLPGTPIRSASR